MLSHFMCDFQSTLTLTQSTIKQMLNWNQIPSFMLKLKCGTISAQQKNTHIQENMNTFSSVVWG